MKSYSNQLSMGVSILVSMATVFVVCYYLAGTMNASKAMQAICGMVGMIIIMIIEVVLIVIRTNDIDEHVAKRKKKNAPRPEHHAPSKWAAEQDEKREAGGANKANRLVM